MYYGITLDSLSMPTHHMLLSVRLEDIQDSLRCYVNLQSPVTCSVQCKVLNICRGLQNEVKCKIRLEKLSDDRLIMTAQEIVTEITLLEINGCFLVSEGLLFSSIKH